MVLGLEWVTYIATSSRTDRCIREAAGNNGTGVSSIKSHGTDVRRATEINNTGDKT